MNYKSSPQISLKQKALHEIKEMVALTLYLAFFFCALATYRMLLLRQFHVESLTFAFAVINALVVAKVIMIGEFARVGRRHESKPLLGSTIWKAFVFGLLVLVFHFAEEMTQAACARRRHRRGLPGETPRGSARPGPDCILHVHYSLWVQGISSGPGRGKVRRHAFGLGSGERKPARLVLNQAWSIPL